MRIDIEPEVHIGDKSYATIMDTRGINIFYTFMQGTKNISVEFTKDELDKFIPNKTVSEVIKEWETGFKETYDKYKTAIDTGIHPIWKSNILDPNRKPWESKKTIEVPYELNERELKGLKGYLKRLELTTLPIHFIAILSPTGLNLPENVPIIEWGL